MAAGGFQTCGLTQAGKAWCWGENVTGALGNGTTDASSIPAKVADGHSFSEIVVGAKHACALDANGAAWCWGADDLGQLGDGNPGADKLSPVAVTGGVTFLTLAAGSDHSCGVAADGGGAWCWGSNSFGQVTGDPLTGSSYGAPVALPAPDGVLFPISFNLIGAGFAHTCAAANDTDGGQVWCWGHGLQGELGPPDENSGFRPVGSLFRAVVPGRGHPCTLARSGPLRPHRMTSPTWACAGATM